MQRKYRVNNPVCSSPGVLDSLFAALDFRAVKTVLDPWAENPAVSMRFAVPSYPNVFVANRQVTPKGKDMQLPKSVQVLNFHPLESHLYTQVANAVSLDACVMIPPPELLDLALITALYHTERVVCMHVPVSYVAQATSQRLDFFTHCEALDRILTVTARSDPSHCWLCIFHTADALHCMARPDVDTSLRWTIVDA
jgi:hypothetical protein